MTTAVAFQPSFTVQLGDPSQTYGIRVTTDSRIEVATEPFESSQVTSCAADNTNAHTGNRKWCCAYDGWHQIFKEKVLFLLSSTSDDSNLKHVWCFDPTASTHERLKCVLGSLQDPHFLHNRIVEFDGINTREARLYAHVLVYDLTREQGRRHIATYAMLSQTMNGRWGGSVDTKAGTLTLWNQRTPQQSHTFNVMTLQGVNGKLELFDLSL